MISDRLDVVKLLLGLLIKLVCNVKSHVQVTEIAQRFNLLLLFLVNVKDVFTRLAAKDLGWQKRSRENAEEAVATA